MFRHISSASERNGSNTLPCKSLCYYATLALKWRTVVCIAMSISPDRCELPHSQSVDWWRLIKVRLLWMSRWILRVGEFAFLSSETFDRRQREVWETFPRNKSFRRVFIYRPNFKSSSPSQIYPRADHVGKETPSHRVLQSTEVAYLHLI